MNKNRTKWSAHSLRNRNPWFSKTARESGIVSAANKSRAATSPDTPHWQARANVVSRLFMDARASPRGLARYFTEPRGSFFACDAQKEKAPHVLAPYVEALGELIFTTCGLGHARFRVAVRCCGSRRYTGTTAPTSRSRPPGRGR